MAFAISNVSESISTIETTSAHLVTSVLQNLVNGTDPGPPTVYCTFGVIPQKALKPGVRQWCHDHGSRSQSFAYTALNDTTLAGVRQTLLGRKSPLAVILDDFDFVETKPALQGIVTQVIKTCQEQRKPFISSSRADPRTLELTPELGELVKSQISVKRWPTLEFYYEQYIDTTQLIERLRNRFSRICRPQNWHPQIIVERLLKACIEELRFERSRDNTVFVEPATRLLLPPRPRTAYKERAGKYGSKISLDEFVRKEWGDYTKHHLLYAEHLRIIDFPLYMACYYQAKQLGVPFKKYVLGLGILAKEHVVKPSPGLEKAASALQQARRLSEARRFAAKAAEILDGAPQP